MRTASRLLPALFILLAAALAYASGAARLLDWQSLAAQRQTLQALVQSHPAAAMALYVAGYAAIVTLSLPIAAFITVTGGFLFGPAIAIPLTILGATAGSSLIFFAVRGALAPLLTGRFARAMERIGPALRRDGLSYMLVLRLLPVVPFWLVNIAAGLSGIPWRSFAFGTLLGIIPATAVFSSLGNGIADLLDSGHTPNTAVLFSPPILFPLAGLAVLALLPPAWRHWRRSDG